MRDRPRTRLDALADRHGTWLVPALVGLILGGYALLHVLLGEVLGGIVAAAICATAGVWAWREHRRSVAPTAPPQTSRSERSEG